MQKVVGIRLMASEVLLMYRFVAEVGVGAGEGLGFGIGKSNDVLTRSAFNEPGSVAVLG